MSICYGLALGIAIITCPDPQPAKSTVVVCPKISTWSAGFQSKLAAEISSLPADSAAAVAVGQLINVRDQVRACQKRNTGN